MKSGMLAEVYRPAGEFYDAFAAMSAQRTLIMGGTVLIVAGLIFGDVFAVFVVHQNASRISEARGARGP